MDGEVQSFCFLAEFIFYLAAESSYVNGDHQHDESKELLNWAPPRLYNYGKWHGCHL